MKDVIRASNEKRYDWHTDGMWCIETGKWVSWADYERLQLHKAALLQLVREGLEIQSAATLVMWQKRLEFCIANEPPALETRAFPQAPETDERYNVSDGLLETLIEVAQDNGFRDVVEALRELQVRRGSRSQKANSCAYCEAGMQKVKEDLHYDATNNSSHPCTMSEGER